jgi:hypothetical protein
MPTAVQCESFNVEVTAHLIPGQTFDEKEAARQIRAMDFTLTTYATQILIQVD